MATYCGEDFDGLCRMIVSRGKGKHPVHYDLMPGLPAMSSVIYPKQRDICDRIIGFGTIHECDRLKISSLPTSDDVNKLFRKSYNLVQDVYQVAAFVLK